ncbi:ribosome quality control complex subunit NEMF homolog [Condylostylus longicornis]|uniref:ribosome quality control complex subunit NEMF homolog n=1 Tax=Condylostylus longicornis TaxID=2530218 RepID=UPI00244DCD0C|nr:ribosome quality control complex subunit NEMF homolog [Condylostylus longicornis]
MKVRFNTFDIICGVTELQRLVGLRVNQIYDIDNKTYLIRFQQGETKEVLLLESGNRFHPTAFEWPKNVAPSGFSMKLRKHLKNKRLEKVEQLGIDRIVDFQFGSGEAAYHIILELYDRGNILLTDHELTILNILRPHTEGETVRFAVREKYPVDRAKSCVNINEEYIKTVLKSAKPGENLRTVLVPFLECGPSVITHVLLKYDLDDCTIPGETENKEVENPTQNKKSKKQKKKDHSSKNGRCFDFEIDFPNLMKAIDLSNEIVADAKKSPSRGYMIQKKELKAVETGEEEYFYHNLEYHPYKFVQYHDQHIKEYESFMACVDEFYSTLEGQKIDLKTVHQEREALKKLSNVKKDHAKRLEELTKVQEQDKQKAELITRNQALVDNAILAVRSAVANQMSWPDIHDLVKAAQLNGDPVASSIKQLKLEVNHIALTLSDPFKNVSCPSEDHDNEDDDETLPTLVIDVDLALSAWANARKYYDQKRSAAKKEQKTIDASEKALKSAERKTQQTLKEVRTISTITKARKVYWFEKFYWFISSENYLVIGGRDAQQNELIVKRYMRPSDVYVHAEIQGASSVVIRNPTGGEIPPKTLLEAGTMAISYSVAWDAKVVTNAYWVKSEQVSKTAPSGEYLGTGSFMIRGKKNFLPPCHLVMGLTLLFKLEESSVERHKGERKVRHFDDDDVESLRQLTIENEKLDSVPEEQEVNLEDSDNEDENKNTETQNVKVINEKNGSNESINEEEIQSENSDKESSDEESSKFPDTHIKVEHDTGKITVRVNSKEENKIPNITNESNTEIKEDIYLIPAAPTRTKQQQNSKKKKAEKEKKAEEYRNRNEEKQNQSQVKRGQKGKLKKIKTKYKDQDEEERELRMAILKSARKDKIKDTKKVDEDNLDTKGKTKRQFQPKQEAQDVDDGDDIPANADVDMLDSLTGIPVDEDELLFAIPVVAPYQSMQHYKFKIKLTPGPGKRGKAAKTALLMFSKDKSCSLREKDLLKGIKEEALARNIPGKVKMSAPQLQKFKK